MIPTATSTADCAAHQWGSRFDSQSLIIRESSIQRIKTLCKTIRTTVMTAGHINLGAQSKCKPTTARVGTSYLEKEDLAPYTTLKWLHIASMHHCRKHLVHIYVTGNLVLADCFWVLGQPCRSRTKIQSQCLSNCPLPNVFYLIRSENVVRNTSDSSTYF